MSDEVEATVAADMAAQSRWVSVLRPLASLLKFRLPWAEGSTEYLAGAVALPIWAPPTTTESRLIVPSPELMSVLRVKLPLTRSADASGTAVLSQSNACILSAAFQEANAALYGEHSLSCGLPYARVLWSNTVYGEQLFYFNTNTRVRAYHHEYSDACMESGPVSGTQGLRKRARELPAGSDRVSSAESECYSQPHPDVRIGLDHCFDCSAEVCILSAYMSQLWSRASTLPARVQQRAVRRLSSAISAAISPKTGRNLTMQISEAARDFPAHVSGVLVRKCTTACIPNLTLFHDRRFSMRWQACAPLSIDECSPQNTTSSLGAAIQEAMQQNERIRAGSAL
jgi:hypothetical protein